MYIFKALGDSRGYFGPTRALAGDTKGCFSGSNGIMNTPIKPGDLLIFYAVLNYFAVES